MRTAKELHPQVSKVYSHELEACLICGTPLVRCDYLSGRKTVQTLPTVMKIAYRPKRCPVRDCISHEDILRSAEWQHIAPRNCTYGFDVIASIGWQRQTLRQPFADIQAELGSSLAISASQVRHLYYDRYHPLLACHERQHLGQLQQVAAERGLILTMDGLAPEGGEPQLWLVRELQTGLTLRSGWMSEQSQSAFENFLQPIAELGLRVTAIMSDKQRGLVPAIDTIFPQAKRGFCQLHYLNNAAEPVATADAGMKISLRKAVREQVGDLIRPEQVENPGVLTVTGLIPSPLVDEQLSDPESEPAQSDPVEQEREEIVTAFKRRVRYLLTLKGRPPFRLAGVEMYQRLSEVAECLDTLIAHAPHECLVQLQQGISYALELVEADYLNLEQAATWLRDISDLLDPEDKPPRTGQEVREELFAYLDNMRKQSQGNPVLTEFATQIGKTTRNYESGLFHTYDIPGLPRTNNERESEFRGLNQLLLRITGQQGATRRIIQRSGAWELIPRPSSFSETVEALSQVNHDEYQKERERVRTHRDRFKFHTRSVKQSRKQLQELQERWLRLSPDELPV